MQDSLESRFSLLKIAFVVLLLAKYFSKIGLKRKQILADSINAPIELPNNKYSLLQSRDSSI
ncbi:hypothetical protein CCY99_09160 [Helicobacter sp. 16-1353]|uniref:hypothetical protein n=1 Tax=Helicobacter sp. 16-1353 TaxID=2004996 RepID=UPI000DCBC2BF|nr:hypothetical protein [Helicobacter sp. 16-1353]RAX51437.1 hypothetical protein CCY99_09160 [Helicobacter sp. 16-1353]